MLRQSGIYTLLGSKPMSLVDMSYMPPTKEQRLQVWNDHPASFKEKYSSEDLYFRPSNDRVILKKWKKFESKLLGNKFRFIEIEDHDLLFINIELTKKLILDYQDVFKNLLGENITPEEIINCMENSSSKYWHLISQNHKALGLLLGYGLHNATCFQKFMEDRLNPELSYASTTSSKTFRQEHPKLSNVSIPGFRVFPGGENQVERYKLERKEILSKCSNRDFPKTALKHLKENISTE